MLAVIATIALVVYEWVGLDFLRRGWINFDLLWSAMLALSGIYMLPRLKAQRKRNSCSWSHGPSR